MNDIKLSKLSEQDIELVRNWRNSPEVAPFMYDESFISEENQRKWFSNLNENTSRYWIIEYQHKKLGLAYLTGINYVLSSCYWGFYIGDFSVRGAGLGAKVEYNILNYVFNELKLNKLRCEVLTSNEKVIRMHEKYGFRREAYYREHCIKGDKKIDVVGLAILNYEWELIRELMRIKIYGI